MTDRPHKEGGTTSSPSPGLRRAPLIGGAIRRRTLNPRSPQPTSRAPYQRDSGNSVPGNAKAAWWDDR